MQFTGDIPNVDIGFALNSVTADSVVIFTLMKNVINTIVQRYGVSRVRFSVIVYGSRKTTRLADFSQKFTQEDLIRAVNDLDPVPTPSSSQLEEALKTAERIFKATARPDAKKVFVVLTDSQSADSGNALEVQTARLRRQDVLILSVGFGSQSDQIGKQMNTVLFTSRDYIGVPNYPTERKVVIAEAIMFKALEGMGWLDTHKYYNQKNK